VPPPPDAVAAARAEILAHRVRLQAQRLRAQTVLGGLWVNADGDMPSYYAAAVPLLTGAERAALTEGHRHAVAYAAVVGKAGSAARAQAAPVASLLVDRPRHLAPPDRLAAAPIVQFNVSRAAGMSRAVAIHQGLARAHVAAARVVVRAADEATTMAARASGAFQGWRRVISGNPCDVCASLATEAEYPVEDDMDTHPGCRCTRAWEPVGGGVLDGWLPTGDDALAALGRDQATGSVA
jgi:hypothetical protein